MAEHTLQVGEIAPDFTLPNERGEPVHLADFHGKRVVLYFYPMDNTPGCTTQACSIRDVYLDIEERNGVVLGISPDDTTSHQAFKTKYALPFTLLVDADHAVARAYGAWQDGAQYVTQPVHHRRERAADRRSGAGARQRERPARAAVAWRLQVGPASVRKPRRILAARPALLVSCACSAQAIPLATQQHRRCQQER